MLTASRRSGYQCTVTLQTTVAEITTWAQDGSVQVAPTATPMIAALVQIRWQPTDIPILKADPLANVTSAKHSGGGDAGGLPSGTIAVVVILPLIAVVCLAWFFLYGRRHSRMWEAKTSTRRSDSGSRHIEMQRVNRWRSGLPEFRTDDSGLDPQAAHVVEEPETLPRMVESETPKTRIEGSAKGDTVRATSSVDIEAEGRASEVSSLSDEELQDRDPPSTT